MLDKEAGQPTLGGWSWRQAGLHVEQIPASETLLVLEEQKVLPKRGSLWEEQFWSLEGGGRIITWGGGQGWKTGPRRQALTFPAGSPSVWLSAMRLEPLGDAGCSWWMDGRTVGRGCNLRSEVQVGRGTEREARFQRPRNLEVGLRVRSGSLGTLGLCLGVGPGSSSHPRQGMWQPLSHPPGPCCSKGPRGRWDRCWASCSRHRTSSWLCGATASDVGTTFC